MPLLIDLSVPTVNALACNIRFPFPTLPPVPPFRFSLDIYRLAFFIPFSISTLRCHPLLIALQAPRSDFRTSCTSHYHLPHSGAVPFTPYVFLHVAPMSISFTNSFQPCPRVRTCQPRNPSWSSLDGSARRPAACTSTLLLTQSSLLTLCSTACFLPPSLASTSSEPALHCPNTTALPEREIKMLEPAGTEATYYLRG
jgi:hypothetical protein